MHEGGRVRGLDRMMPAFGGALTDEEISRSVDYVRGLLPDLPDWPLGELNLPRALFTEKAFPENEVVLTSTIAAARARQRDERAGLRAAARRAGDVRGRRAVRRAGPDRTHRAGGTASTGWTAGLGDLGFAFKDAVVQSARTGSILALGLDVSVPTGRTDQGLGAGVTVFDPFVAFGQILPAGSFAQAHAGVDLPVDTTIAKPDVFWRALLGWSVSAHRFGRMYSPMLEVLGTRELDTAGAVVTWDLVPQMQVTLSRRKHVRVDVGAEVPVNQTADRHVQLGCLSAVGLVRGKPLQGVVKMRQGKVALLFWGILAARDLRAGALPGGIAAAAVLGLGPLPGLPQRHDHSVGGRCLDWLRLAGVDHGQRRAGSLLAGCGPARGHRPSSGRPRPSRTSARPATCR